MDIRTGKGINVCQECGGDAATGHAIGCSYGQEAATTQRVLRVRDLVLLVDAYGQDPVEEARDVVRHLNRVAESLSGDPVLDFDLTHSADIEAEYIEEVEG